LNDQTDDPAPYVELPSKCGARFPAKLYPVGPARSSPELDHLAIPRPAEVAPPLHEPAPFR
jgi:hypothetical protein